LIPLFEDLFSPYNIADIDQDVFDQGYGDANEVDVDDAVDVEMVITTLSTQFDPSLTDNQKFPAEHDMRLNVAWTKRERELAEKGAAVSDVSELQRKVSG
jgi:hypothetical protein